VLRFEFVARALVGFEARLLWIEYVAIPHSPQYRRTKVRAVVPRWEDPCLSTAILTAILDHGVSVDISDLENPDEVLGTLSYEGIKERLHLLDMSLDYKWALEAHEEEVGDAESADVVFQFLVMGDVWFS